MSNGYKAALQRFEDAVRAVALAGPYHTRAERDAIASEYEAARRHIVQKLSYRALSAELRHEQQLANVPEPDTSKGSE